MLMSMVVVEAPEKKTPIGNATLISARRSIAGSVIWSINNFCLLL
jgi:hypothetical protein